jgi:uncharacterized protein (TIGR04255 family)
MSPKTIKSSKRSSLASKHYAKAPLTEAILDIRVELSSEIGPSRLVEVFHGQEETYSKQEEIFIVHGQMSVGPQISARQTSNGYRFVSKDGREIFQARLDGFTFHRLAPYQAWELFRDEARRLWNAYKSIAAPKNVTRIGVRYINRIDLPLPIADFKDYLRTVPEVSPSMPQGLSGYFMQLQIPQVDLNAKLVLNQALIPPPAPKMVSVLLDIDLFSDSDLPTDEQGLWERFEGFRNRKNKVFEACITERVRRLIA